MKLFLIAVLLAAASASVPARAADVGVSVSVGQPGFYGRLDIGDYPAPQVFYRQPRLINRDGIGRQPIYMHVPPNHARHWRRHCRQYDACGERVYFVRDNWYNNEYVPRYQERDFSRQEERHDWRHEDGRGEDRQARHHGGYDRDYRR